MRLQRVAFALALLVGSGGAFAHAHLNSSTPAAGAQLTVAPQTLTLEFSEAAQLTALSLARAGAAPLKLTAPSAPASRIRIALPALTPGTWTVHFRALSADGHLVPGELSFTLAP
jgi:methionine-rich copper-binding protein CopC